MSGISWSAEEVHLRLPTPSPRTTPSLLLTPRRAPCTPLPKRPLRARLMRSQECSTSRSRDLLSSELWPRQTTTQESFAELWSEELTAQARRPSGRQLEEIRRRLGPVPCHGNCVALVYNRQHQCMRSQAYEELPMNLKPKVQELLGGIKSFQFPRRRNIQNDSRETEVKAVHVVDRRLWGQWGLDPDRFTWRKS
ncbi:unnamed protein product [Durusdinium trenchii]|uniref:Uncharacterized protein n=2 Tax=Durusdinium trenchii TaxID=1381693 RepID=A0ABP0J9R1_9DINO